MTRFIFTGFNFEFYKSFDYFNVHYIHVLLLIFHIYRWMRNMDGVHESLDYLVSKHEFKLI